MNGPKSKQDREKLVGELNTSLESFFDVDDVEFDNDQLFPIQVSLAKGDKLRELNEVARGGEKKIIKAFDSKADRYIALARPIDNSSEGKERFLREARITASLEHPNIISVFEMSLDGDEKPFFTTELLENRTLKKIIEDFHSNHQGELEDMLDILLKICDAIAYAHSRNVLHLDLKPDNIHVGAYGDVLVIDWGLAKILNDKDELYLNESDLNSDLLNDLTLTGTLKGTPGYMAPEQAGLNGEKNQQTDIYALGALLFTMLSGKFHVEGANQIELLENTRLGNVRDLPAEVPSSLRAVCLKALDLNQQYRYENVEAFKLELQSYLRGFATKAEDAGFVKQIKLLYKRKPLACQVLIGAIFVIVLGTGLFIKELSLREAEAVSLQLEAENTLKLYEEGKKKRELMVDNMYRALLDLKSNAEVQSDFERRIQSLLVASSIGSSRKLDFENAMELCNIGLRLKPGDPLILAEKGFFHIIDHEFTAANKCFNECATDAPHIFEIHRVVKEYVKIKPDDSKRMSLEMTMDFVSKLPNHRNWLRMYLLERDRQLSESLSEHSKMVREYIYFLNPEMKRDELKFNFVESSNGNSLSLAGSKSLKTLMNMAGPQFKYRSILGTLELKYLDISNTAISSLQNLDGLKLRELNIAGTKVIWPGQLKKLDKEFLELLTVKKDQIKNFSSSRFENVEVLELP